jgi:hypothetical protein
MVHEAVTKAAAPFLLPGEQLRYGARARFLSTVMWKRALKLGRRRGYVAVSDRRVLMIYDGEGAPTSIPFDQLAEASQGVFVHEARVVLREAGGTERVFDVSSLLGEDTYGHATFIREAIDFVRTKIGQRA